jgi:hypothetical protein
MQHYMRREAGRERLPKPQRVAMVWRCFSMGSC